MRVVTTRFGEIEVDDDLVLTFPRGLYGLEDYTRYCLLSQFSTTPFTWLQSAEEPDLALVVASPFVFYPDYDVEVDDAEIADISAGSHALPNVMCVVTVGRQASSVTMNLRAPIVIFEETRLGRQVILNDLRHATRAPLSLSALRGQKEATDACTDAKSE